MRELPDKVLDALLAGDLPAEDLAAGLQPAVPLLAALTGAPQGGELAGHAWALAQFRRADAVPAGSRHAVRRRPRMLTSLRSARAAAAAAAAAAVLGGAATAAYAGALPGPAQQFAHNTIGAPAPHQSPASHPAATPSGPGATGPAASGLCTAYSHARAHGSAGQVAVAFRNLATAAGGAANITAYCATVHHPGGSQTSAPATVPASHPTRQPSPLPTAHPTGQPTAHPTGKPAPTSHPTGQPTSLPTTHPTGKPALVPAEPATAPA